MSRKLLFISVAAYVLLHINLSHQLCTIVKTVAECRNVSFKHNKKLVVPEDTRILKLYSTIKEIPPGAFTPCPNITALYMNHTMAEKIYSSSFDGLKNLKELDMYWNQISTIPPRTFNPCPGLVYLNLGGNGITSLDHDIFRNLNHLRELILSSNVLSQVPYLEYLISLKSLDLSGNQVRVLDREAFRGLRNLEHLNLRGNQIRYIENDAFLGLLRLRFLNLERNNLRAVNAANVAQNLPDLRLIRLGINKFSCEHLEGIIRDFSARGVIVPEGLAEPGPISYHGIFCLPERNSIS